MLLVISGVLNHSPPHMTEGETPGEVQAKRMMLVTLTLLLVFFCACGWLVYSALRLCQAIDRCEWEVQASNSGYT